MKYTVFSLDNSSYRYRMLHNPKISGFETHKINKTNEFSCLPRGAFLLGFSIFLLALPSCVAN